MKPIILLIHGEFNVDAFHAGQLAAAAEQAQSGIEYAGIYSPEIGLELAYTHAAYAVLIACKTSQHRHLARRLRLRGYEVGTAQIGYVIPF